MNVNSILEKHPKIDALRYGVIGIDSKFENQYFFDRFSKINTAETAYKYLKGLGYYNCYLYDYEEEIFRRASKCS